MTRAAKAAALLAASTLAALGIAGAAGASRTAAHTTNLTLWVYFSNPELGVMKNVVAQFEKTHPSIHVSTIGGVSDQKILAAIRGGNAPDVAQSGSSDNTGAYCGSGAWIDLRPYMAQDNLSANLFPPAPRFYTQYKGTRCALPMLADAYGLYYNKTLFRKAGITHPPRTISELTADAKKLTQRGKNGMLTVVGFDPVNGWYENAPAHYAPAFGAQWVDAKGNSIIAKSPGWSAYLRWQKSLIDWYGYSNLVRFNAGAGDEFAPSNAFERGKVAMNLDGEWRVAFLKKEHPELQYGVAPFPVADSSPELYGSGYTSGSILGIPKTSKHKDEAWQLVKWLATNTTAEAMLANGILNVPTTTAAAHSKLLKTPPKFNVFVKIFNDRHTATTPITPIGAANQNLFSTFVNSWQAGHAKGLAAGLANVDKQINAALKQAGGGGSQVP
jgi:multiple sugar transport system substrate-binding protein